MNEGQAWARDASVAGALRVQRLFSVTIQTGTGAALLDLCRTLYAAGRWLELEAVRRRWEADRRK